MNSPTVSNAEVCRAAKSHTRALEQIAGTFKAASENIKKEAAQGVNPSIASGFEGVSQFFANRLASLQSACFNDCDLRNYPGDTCRAVVNRLQLVDLSILPTRYMADDTGIRRVNYPVQEFSFSCLWEDDRRHEFMGQGERMLTASAAPDAPPRVQVCTGQDKPRDPMPKEDPNDWDLRYWQRAQDHYADLKEAVETGSATVVDATTIDGMDALSMCNYSFAAYHVKDADGEAFGHLLLSGVKKKCPSPKSCETSNPYLRGFFVGPSLNGEIRGAGLIPGAVHLYCAACQPPALKSGVCRQYRADIKAGEKEWSR